MGIGSSNETPIKQPTNIIVHKRPDSPSTRSVTIPKKSTGIGIDNAGNTPVMMIVSPTESSKLNIARSGGETVPTVFTWRNGGKDVQLVGSFNDWMGKIPMYLSHGDFTCIQNLAPGRYLYRFIVDGKWQADPSQPMISDANGETNNVLEIFERKEDGFLFGKGSFPNDSIPFIQICLFFAQVLTIYSIFQSSRGIHTGNLFIL